MRTSEFDPVSAEFFRGRLIKARVIVLAAFAVLFLQLWLLQIVWGPSFRKQSENNRLRLRDITPFRGIIKDRNGEVLASNRPSFDLYVTPKDVDDSVMLVDKISELTGTEQHLVTDRLEAGARRSYFRPVVLKRDISRDEVALLEAHRFNLPGIMVEAKPVRYYLYGTLASHLLGYMGEISDRELKSGQYPDAKPGDMIGKAGVESSWQETLAGTVGAESLEVDAVGRIIKVLSRRPPVAGKNLWLTIDRRLQSAAENALAGKKGAIVAMEPSTGRILAMASSPPFEPNIFVEGIQKASWEELVGSEEFPLQNRAISGQYPPGSVFKIVVALAALEEGIIDPREHVFCPGSYSLGGHEFRCWKKHGHGSVDLHRAIVESCDVYFYNVGRRLGVDAIASYARRLGLGVQTGIDLMNEKAGLVPTTAWKQRRMGDVWHQGETISVSIGQGYVLVTPLQIARMISSVFNGGILYKPQVALCIEEENGKKVRFFEPEAVGRIEISPKALEIVRKALVGAVNEPGGTGSKAALKDVLSAGKTGTAQVIRISRDDEKRSEEDLPDKMRDHAWFAGVAPADNPRIAIAVIIENSGHGGRVAAPVAGELFSAYLQLEEVGRVR
jgi:penicillin-binding protein 2